MRENLRKDASGGRKDLLACSSRAQSVMAGKAMVGRPVCEAGLPAPAVRRVRKKCWSSAHSWWFSFCMEAPKGHCMKALRCGDTRTTGCPEEVCRHGVEMGQERGLVYCGTELAGQAPSSLFELRRCHQKLQMPELEVQDLVFSLLGFSLALVWPFFVMPTFLHFGTFHCMSPFMLQGLTAKRLSIRSNASLILLYSVTTTEDFWDQIKFILLYGPAMGLIEAPAPFMPITQDRQGQRW